MSEDVENKMTTTDAAKHGSLVNAVVNSKGWIDVIRPALLSRRESLIGDISSAVTYEDFVRIQQAMNAILGLLDFIEVKLMAGEEAIKELKENP